MNDYWCHSDPFLILDAPHCSKSSIFQALFALLLISKHYALVLFFIKFSYVSSNPVFVVKNTQKTNRVKLYDGGLSSIRWKLHISERSSFLKYAVAIIKCPMGGQFMMATAYLFKELVSEICSFYRIELRPPS